VNAADTTESTPGLHEGSGVSVSSAPSVSGAPNASDPGACPPGAAKATGKATGKGRVGRGFAALFPLLLLAVIAWVDFPLCPFRVLTGVDCPGCGLTRATGAMLQLHIGEMLRLHPLAPIFAPLVILTLVRGAARSLGRPLPPLPFRVPDAMWIGLTVLLLGLWALRLAGYLGGVPDPIDFSHGLIGRAVNLVF